MAKEYILSYANVPNRYFFVTGRNLYDISKRESFVANSPEELVDKVRGCLNLKRNTLLHLVELREVDKEAIATFLDSDEAKKINFDFINPIQIGRL